MLVCCGQPAVAEGNVIYVNDFPLEVARACSGLRMFMSIAALAFAYIVLTRGNRIVKIALALFAAPIAVVANSLRIAATGLAYAHWTGEEAQHFSHDVAGWAMIPLAAGLMGLVLLYLRFVFVEIQHASPVELLRRPAGA
jgi:exosortase